MRQTKTVCLKMATQYYKKNNIVYCGLHRYLFFACAGYAFATGHYDLVPPAALLGLSSITYWYYPDYSWRRKLDMAVAHSALAYQLCRAYRAQHASLYYSTIAIAVSFYPMGIVAHKFGDGWLSTLFHSQLHLIGNMASFILYSGYIPPFWETVSYLGAVFPLNNKMWIITHKVLS